MPSGHWALIGIATGQPQAFPSGEAIVQLPNGTARIDRRSAWALSQRGELDDVGTLLQSVQIEREELEAGAKDSFGFTRGAIQELNLVEAELLRSIGDESGAENLINQTLNEIAASGDAISALTSQGPLVFLSAEFLASRLEARGDIDGAIAVLENWGGRQGRTDMQPSNVVFWTRNRYRLSLLLEERDPTRAAELRLELERMLEFADEDHYIAKALRTL